MAALYNIYIDKTGSTYTPTVRYQATAPSDGTNLSGVRDNSGDLTGNTDFQKVLSGCLSVVLNDKSVRGV